MLDNKQHVTKVSFHLYSWLNSTKMYSFTLNKILYIRNKVLTLLHSERPKLYTILACKILASLSAIGHYRVNDHKG